MHRTASSHRPVRRTLLALVAAVGALASTAATAQAAITGTENANDLASAITGAPASGATLDAALQGDTGYFPDAVADASLGGFPTGGGTFSILTSGDATLADQPNDSESAGAALGYTNPARGEAYDPTTLGVPFTVPDGSNCVAFDYKFLSEEFPEFVNAGFNDAFIAELDTTNWNVSGNVIAAPNDFAAPAGDKVSVDSVGPTAVDPANAAGTTYDAATTVLTTKAAAAPGSHTIYLSVFDSGDPIYDSAVFVDNIRFTNEPAQTCKPPDLFGGAVGVDVGDSAKVKGKSALIPIECQLEVGITVNCEGSIGLFGKLPNGRAVHAAKAKRLGKGNYSVAPGQKGKAKVKLTKKALRALAKSGKLKTTAKVTNASNGATDSFKVKLKGKKKG